MNPRQLSNETRIFEKSDKCAARVSDFKLVCFQKVVTVTSEDKHTSLGIPGQIPIRTWPSC